MTHPVLKTCCIALALNSAPAPLLAVWPPSTSLAAETAALSSNAEPERFPSGIHQDVQTVTRKLAQDERQLAKAIQDLENDEAALKKLTQDNSGGIR